MFRHLVLAVCLILGTASTVLAQGSSGVQYYNAGVKAYQEGDYDKAVLYLKTAVNFDPKDWRAQQALGLAQYKSGDRNAALSSFDRSLELNPDNAQLRTFADKLRQAPPPAPPPQAAASAPASRPSSSAKPDTTFGIGAEFGDPGTFGVTAKLFVTPEFAVQPSAKFDGGTILQCDALWHIYGLTKLPQGRLPFYLGAGGGIGFAGSVVVFEARGVAGIDYFFDQKDLPLDIYLQVVPALWFGSGGSSPLQVYADLGARWWF